MRRLKMTKSQRPQAKGQRGEHYRPKAASCGPNIKSILGVFVLIGGLFWLGVLLHEAGHVAAGGVFGARLTSLNVLGLDLLPSLRWNPMPGYYGFMDYSGDLSPSARDLVDLAGSLATLGVAVAAQLSLWLTRPQRGIIRWVNLTLCFFWLDVLTHTLPTLGIPSYLFFGARTTTQSAEAYLAAGSLGMPGWLFQALAVGLSIVPLAMTIVRWKLLIQVDKLNEAMSVNI